MTANDVVMWLIAHWIVPTTIVFLLILVTTYWPGRRARFERDAMIPLHDDR
jgi:cbb3-type cytochrome oxidase subunit 3